MAPGFWAQNNLYLLNPSRGVFTAGNRGWRSLSLINPFDMRTTVLNQPLGIGLFCCFTSVNAGRVMFNAAAKAVARPRSPSSQSENLVMAKSICMLYETSSILIIIFERLSYKNFSTKNLLFTI